MYICRENLTDNTVCEVGLGEVMQGNKRLRKEKGGERKGIDGASKKSFSSTHTVRNDHGNRDGFEDKWQDSHLEKAKVEDFEEKSNRESKRARCEVVEL